MEGIGTPLPAVLKGFLAEAPGPAILPRREVPGGIPSGSLPAGETPLPAVRVGAWGVIGRREKYDELDIANQSHILEHAADSGSGGAVSVPGWNATQQEVCTRLPQ